MPVCQNAHVAARFSPEEEQQARNAAFEHVLRHMDPVSEVVESKHFRAFSYGGEIIHLTSQQRGIHRPKQFHLPMSIRTAPPKSGRDAPYANDIDMTSGLLMYRYRGKDPNAFDNVILRQAMETGTPLLHLYGVSSGRYIPSVAYLIGEQRRRHSFATSLSNIRDNGWRHSMLYQSDVDRATRTRNVCERLGQTAFRFRVLDAYNTKCALCRLNQPLLLEAAPIVPFAEYGPSVVPNGLAMCNLHHRAFDTHIIGIVPQRHVVEIRDAVRKQTDGPMLEHGLKEFHGTTLEAPRGGPSNRPDDRFLEQRYEEFLRAA